MILRINYQKDRDGEMSMNFDATMITKEDCDKALAALAICRDILPDLAQTETKEAKP